MFDALNHCAKVPLTHNINDIKSQLTNIDQNIQIEGLHRKQSRPIPTTLILFKTNNEHSQKLLLHNTTTQQLHIYNHQIHTKNTDQMYKLPENWSPQTPMQATNTLCEMCMNLLLTTQLQKRYQEMH